MLKRGALALLVWLIAHDVALAACTGSPPTQAATADESSFQTCVTNAQAAGGNQTITVAAGSFTVTTGVLVALSNSTNLTITGAGIGNTVITDQGSAGYALKVTGANASNFIDISGFTFVASTNHQSGMVQLEGTQAAVGFRFHHNRLLQDVLGRGLAVRSIYGLVDHVTFDDTTGVSVQQVSIYGTDTSNDVGYTPWSRALSFGTNNAVYVEDSTFSDTDIGGEDSIDAYSGARLVIRYNTFTNTHVGFHGTDSGWIRSPVSMEIYENDFINTTTTTNASGGRMRGGTAVIYNNTWSNTSSGSWSNWALTLYRACGSDYNPGVRKCDGTNWQVESATISTSQSLYCNVSGGYGFSVSSPDGLPICTSGVGDCTRYFDGGGTGGYPCRDQPGRGPGQALEPVYYWNNTGLSLIAWNLNDVGDCNGLGVANYILQGRDYYNDGTQRPGYTAYTYPHPLQGYTPDRRFVPLMHLHRVSWPIPYVNEEGNYAGLATQMSHVLPHLNQGA